MAPLTIHPLNCATMCPHGAVRTGIIDRDPGRIVTTCLLIEAPDGLILIDTGFGAADIADRSRLGAVSRLLNPALDPAETAVAQVRSLGYDPADVRRILVTHLDLDHAGGLGDFARATVHVHTTELHDALHPDRRTSSRYRSPQWAHGPDWAEHATGGESWNGFASVRPLEGAAVDIAMIALHGHTRGHSGFAIDTGDGWLLHAGDCYLHRDEIATPPRTNRARRLYHRVNSIDERTRRQNVERLADLAREHRDDVTIVCSHDAHEHAGLCERFGPEPGRRQR